MAKRFLNSMHKPLWSNEFKNCLKRKLLERFSWRPSSAYDTLRMAAQSSGRRSAIACDCDDTSSQSKRPRMSPCSPAAQSPLTLSDALDMPHTCVNRLLEAVSGGTLVSDNPGAEWRYDVPLRLEEACSKGIVVTSSYSGTGGFEFAAGQVFRSLAEELSLGNLDVTMYSAWDNEPAARLALLQHGASAPLHVFGDIMESLPEGACDKITEEAGQILLMWQDIKHEKKAKTMERSECTQWQEFLTEKMLSLLNEKFKDLDFQDKAWCYTHKSYCFISPRSDPQHRDKVWIEGSGSTCCPWAKPGTHDKFLSHSTIVFFTWLHALRYRQPDILIHENTAEFPAQSLLDVLNAEPSSQLKCLRSRTVEDAFETNEHWRSESIVFSPVSLGLPVARDRRYTCLWFAPFCSPDAELFGKFLDVYSADRRSDASIYICARACAVRGRWRAYGRIRHAVRWRQAEARWTYDAGSEAQHVRRHIPEVVRALCHS